MVAASIALVLMLSVSGCSRQPRDNSPPPTITDLRAQLEHVAQTGEGGSSLGGVEFALNGIKSTHRELYDKLEPKYQSMTKTDDAETIKKTAQEMLSEIPAGG
jgi:hypothetical protein